MSRGERILAWGGGLLLFGLHLQGWRPDRVVLYFGWLPEDLAFRLAWIGLAWGYLLFVSRPREDGPR